VWRIIEVVLMLVLVLVGIGAPIWIDFRHWSRKRKRPGL